MEDILFKRKNGYEKMTDKLREEMNEFNEGYKAFLSLCKTERECADFCKKVAEANDFKDIAGYKTLKKGDKFYIMNRGRAILMGVMGKKPVNEGVRVVAAHIDSPRLDLKQNPLYEAEEMAFFKTHYYGGIKKYQWVAMPLAIHGCVVLKGGEKINIVIGEEENDPVFCVTDLLPHLAASQMDQKGGKIIEGEKLNVLIGSEGLMEEEKLSVKKNIMKLLNDKYGITEKDFITADIEVVPAFKAKDVGIDRSMVGSYGQDDRVCAYTALRAILDTEKPEYTSICYLVDKEEIGSCDSTGMKSKFFEDILAKLCYMSCENYCDILVSEARANTICLSADVTAAVDPNYDHVNEKRNSAFFNKGIALMKYSGARGKSGTNDATAELVRKITDIFDENDVAWQTAELGKVDEGGGGTVAQYFAVLNIDVIDCGVPLLSMHAPFEIAAKYDVFMGYKAYKSFYKN